MTVQGPSPWCSKNSRCAFWLGSDFMPLAPVIRCFPLMLGRSLPASDLPLARVAAGGLVPVDDHRLTRRVVHLNQFPYTPELGRPVRPARRAAGREHRHAT